MYIDLKSLVRLLILWCAMLLMYLQVACCHQHLVLRVDDWLHGGAEVRKVSVSEQRVTVGGLLLYSLFLTSLTADRIND